MPRDELDDWLDDVDDGGPLFEAVAARVETLAVDEAEVERVARRVERRATSKRSRAWWILPVLGGLAAAAILARVVPPREAAPPDLDAPPQVVEGLRADPPQTREAPLQAPRPPVAAVEGLESDAVRRERERIEALFARGAVAEAVSATLDFVERFGPGTDGASRHGSAGHHALTAELLRKAAVRAHRHAHAESDEALLAQAGVAYERYLADFAEPEHESGIRYAYGELLYREERFDEAWEQYTRVAEDVDHDKARFCGESAIRAADAMRRLDDSEEWRDRFVASVDTYVAAWPDDAKVPKLQYQAAYAVYESEGSVEAIERMSALAVDAPDTTEGGWAANLALDGYVTAGDFAGAAEFAEAFLALEGVPGDVRAEIHETGARAAFFATRQQVARGADPAGAWAAYRDAWPQGPAPP